MVEKLKTEHVENLSSRVGCRIGNWVTTADCDRVHTPDTTQLNMFRFPIFLPNSSCVGVGGMFELFENSALNYVLSCESVQNFIIILCNHLERNFLQRTQPLETD